MKQSTGRDIQRVTFVDNLYAQLRQQTASAIADRDRLVHLADSYVVDGLSEEECVELMMIEASIARKTAESFVAMSHSNLPIQEAGNEYSFQFSDIYGKVWSSNDIGRTVFANSHDEAMEKAEALIFDSKDVEPECILSVDRIS